MPSNEYIMYCKYCGKQIDDNSTFCNHCGKQLVEKQKITIEFNKPNIPNISEIKETAIKSKDTIVKKSSELYDKANHSNVPSNIGCIILILGWILLFCYGVLGCFR